MLIRVMSKHMNVGIILHTVIGDLHRTIRTLLVIIFIATKIYLGLYSLLELIILILIRMGICRVIR